MMTTVGAVSVVLVLIILSTAVGTYLRDQRDRAGRRRASAEIYRRSQKPPPPAAVPTPPKPPAPPPPPGTFVLTATGNPGEFAAAGGIVGLAGLTMVSTTTARSTPLSPLPQSPKPTPRPPSLDLDAGRFAPVTDDEARRQSAGGTLLVNLYATGRTSIIPPASDPRTLLIDRGMVGHGLITPEQLAEIHRIGEAMETVSADYAAAYRRTAAAVEQAVTLDREARKALKEQKRAAAAERRTAHAKAVARRRATDIVFLGRGVSVGLADRVSDVAKLEAAGLPVLSTPADVATAMELKVRRLRWLAFHSDAATVSHYVRFTVPKKSGGTRQLAAPHQDLAAAQSWVLTNVLAKVAAHAAAHGFVPGRSIVTNATPHVGRAVVVNADLTDFFPTVTFPRVLGVFRQLGYSPAVATVLALLCTEAPRRTVVYAGKPFHVAAGPRSLPQGACTSPALSNLVARRLDSRLTGITAKLGWTYTRYADDLTFSGPADDRVGYLLARVRHITTEEGFAVNEAKTRVQRPNTAQVVTGLVVNEKVNVPRDTVRRLRAILHRAERDGLASQNRDGRPDFAAWLAGMVGYVTMVNPEQGRPLTEALARVRA